MKKNTLNNITRAMLVVSLILTAMMSIFILLAGIVDKAIPPVIALLLATAFFVWIDLFYLNCCKWLNNKIPDDKITLHKLKMQSILFIAIMCLISFSMWGVLFGSVVLYRVFFGFQIYFLIVALVTTVYAINSIFINKAIAKAENVTKNVIDT